MAVHILPTLEVRSIDYVWNSLIRPIENKENSPEGIDSGALCNVRPTLIHKADE